MFEKLFTSSKAVERYSNGALLEDRVRYLVYCAAQGSTRSSVSLRQACVTSADPA